MIMENSVDYSIVIPVYYNEGSLRPTYESIKEKVVAKNPDLTCEIIFVDDGSGDNSYQELLELRNEDPDMVKVIKFTRNFGQASARIAGYHYARGKCLIGISADQQDPPELMNDMLKGYREENYDIVACVRTARDESFFRRFTSRFFFFLMRKLSFKKMPLGGFDYYLISDRVKHILLKNHDTSLFFQGQIMWSGFPIKFIPYVRRKREIGTSRWSFSMKLKLLIDGVLAYSYFPLRLMSVIGTVVALIGFLYAIWIVIAKLSGRIPVEGWAPTIVLILVLSGIQMLMLGIIGEYLWRTLDQVRNRQPYIVEENHVS
jgi:polyisoprenyl-phosphate glycosyltransferase